MKSDFIFETVVSDTGLCDEILTAQKNQLAARNGYEDIHRQCPTCCSPIKTSRDTYWKFIRSGIHPWIAKLGDELGRAYHKYEKKHPYIRLTENGHTFEDFAFNVQSYEPGEGYPMWHHEFDIIDRGTRARMTVWMLYLNDVPDGGTEFMYQDKIVQAEKGKLVIWPAYFTHTHRGVVSPTTEKHIATGWGHHG